MVHWAPLTAALLIYGELYHWALPLLLDAVLSSASNSSPTGCATRCSMPSITTRDMSLLAKRFDTALNNMPHGLCMFDSDRRVVVTNQKLNEQCSTAGLGSQG